MEKSKLVSHEIKVYCDGGARGNPGPAAASFVVVNSDGKVVGQKGFFLGKATNNVAEYKGVLAGLSWLAQNRKGHNATFYLDSQLIVNQLSGKFKIRNKQLLDLAVRIRSVEKEIGGKISYRSVRREKNKLADFLVNKTLNRINS